MNIRKKCRKKSTLCKKNFLFFFLKIQKYLQIRVSLAYTRVALYTGGFIYGRTRLFKIFSNVTKKMYRHIFHYYICNKMDQNFFLIRVNSFLSSTYSWTMAERQQLEQLLARVYFSLSQCGQRVRVSKHAYPESEKKPGDEIAYSQYCRILFKSGEFIAITFFRNSY